MIRPIVSLTLLWALAASPAVQAQELQESRPPQDVATSPALDERASVRLRYSAVQRSGSQEDAGPGLTYKGLTPNDFGLALAFFGGPGWLGAAVDLDREGFSLMGDQGVVTRGTLLRASVGPQARFALGPLRFDFGAAYAYAQLPTFGNSAAPAFAPGVRHALEVNGRARLELPLSLRLEVRGALPLTLAASGQGERARATGATLGAALTIPLFKGDTVGTSLVLDFSLAGDDLTGATFTSRQRMTRFGLAVQLDWLLPRPPEPVGSLVVRVVDAASGTPVKGAAVDLAGNAPHQDRTGADGQATFRGLSPGAVPVHIAAPGYLSADASASIEIGKEQTVDVQLKAEPKVGTVSVVVLEKGTGRPVPGAVVTVQDRELTAGPDGHVQVKDVPAGPVPIAARAPGFVPAQEVASVVAGKGATVAVELAPEAAKVPATLSGLIRSTQGGRPVAALLEIPQAKIKTRASAQGAFTVRLPGGTYNVNISAPGFLSQSKTVTVRDGEQAIFNVDLHPARGGRIE